jgi:hypothetical protein
MLHGQHVGVRFLGHYVAAPSTIGIVASCVHVSLERPLYFYLSPQISVFQCGSRTTGGKLKYFQAQGKGKAIPVTGHEGP